MNKAAIMVILLVVSPLGIAKGSIHHNNINSNNAYDIDNNTSKSNSNSSSKSGADSNSSSKSSSRSGSTSSSDNKVSIKDQSSDSTIITLSGDVEHTEAASSSAPSTVANGGSAATKKGSASYTAPALQDKYTATIQNNMTAYAFCQRVLQVSTDVIQKSMCLKGQQDALRAVLSASKASAKHSVEGSVIGKPMRLLGHATGLSVLIPALGGASIMKGLF